MAARASLRQSEIYVPLAFAAADVLFELQSNGRIAFAVGAAMSLLGRPARLLTELSLGDMVAPSDHERLRRSLVAMARGERVRNVLLEVVRPEGSSVHVMLSGYGHPEKPDILVAVLAHAVGYLPPPPRCDTPSGLMDADEFAAKVSHLMNGPEAEGDHYRMTLLELPEMAEIRQQLGPDGAEAFVQRLGDRLRALSVGADAAGQLSDRKYGVVHTQGVDEEEIRAAVSQASEGTPIPAMAATLMLDVDGIPATDAARALAYTLNRFTKDAGASLALETLHADLQPRLSETVQEMKAIRGVIENGDFQIVFQPIVDLWTNIVHHFEALVRFGDGTRSPYDTVTFAEDTGLVGELDLAVLARVLVIMRSRIADTDALRFAVNLSGRSLGDPRVTGRLRKMLHGAADLKGRLLIEITESYAISDLKGVNAVVQEMRRMGFTVCLDDFGAGAAAFHYLRSLKVDHVKIDGSYVKDCMHNNEHVAFIEAMVQLCTKLGVSTIAEYVEDAATANLLKVLKVRYGQGYHFGKPFGVAPDAAQLDAWTNPRTEWRRGLLHFKG